MANSTSIQILEDGPIRVVVKLEGVLDTSDISSTLLLDPATLSSVDPTGSNVQKATSLRIDRILYNIEDGLSVNFFWDATAQTRIEELAGRGKLDYKPYGGIQLKGSAGVANTIPAGATGKINYTTQGWAAAGILSFSIFMTLTKQF
jgi:hypothetical protein